MNSGWSGVYRCLSVCSSLRLIMIAHGNMLFKRSCCHLHTHFHILLIAHFIIFWPLFNSCVSTCGAMWYDQTKWCRNLEYVLLNKLLYDLNSNCSQCHVIEVLPTSGTYVHILAWFAANCELFHLVFKGAWHENLKKLILLELADKVSLI